MDGDRSRLPAVHDGGHALHKGRGAGFGTTYLACREYPLMAFIGWLMCNALAMSFCMAGLLALVNVGYYGKGWQTPLLIGALFANISAYHQPF